jgi:putative endonuclease
MPQKHSLGHWGEDWAVAFLKLKQFEILERNWRYRQKEIDIIAKKDNVIHIVEVKTRSSTFFGAPEEAVNDTKSQNLTDAGEAYLEEKNLDSELQFDIIAIVATPYRKELSFIEDAFGGF